MAGRPKKPREQTRTNILRIRLTEKERDELDQAAHLSGLDTSTWVRHELLALARRMLAKQGETK